MLFPPPDRPSTAWSIQYVETDRDGYFGMYPRLSRLSHDNAARVLLLGRLVEGLALGAKIAALGN
jgi:hypothetical protein